MNMTYTFWVVYLPTVKEVVDWLSRHYSPDEHVAVDIWCVEDVLERAEERGIKISRKEAEEIIDEIHKNQDATIGINWDVIDAYLDEVKG